MRHDKSSRSVPPAVAGKAGEPLTIEAVDLEGPKEDEVLVEAKATGICHTDGFTLSGADPGSRRLAGSRGPLCDRISVPDRLVWEMPD